MNDPLANFWTRIDREICDSSADCIKLGGVHDLLALKQGSAFNPSVNDDKIGMFSLTLVCE